MVASAEVDGADYHYHILASSAIEAIEAISARCSELEANGDEEAALCVDLEWDSHNEEHLPLSLLQFAVEAPPGRSPRLPDVFDALRIDRVERLDGLQALLEDARWPIKVLHDARGDNRVLLKRGVTLGRLFDTQVAHAVLSRDPAAKQKSLIWVVKEYLDIDLPPTSFAMKKWMKGKHNWIQRPLPEFVLQYAADDVRYLPRLFRVMYDLAVAQGKLSEIFTRSSHRINPKPKWEDKAETAVAFLAWFDDRPDVRAQCEDVQVFRHQFNEWKAAELSAGRVRQCGYNEVITKLLQKKSISRKGQALVFHTAGGTRKSARASALREAAERVQMNRAAIEADKGDVVIKWEGGAAFSGTEEVVCVRPGETATATLVVSNAASAGGATVVLRRVTLLRGGVAGFSIGEAADAAGISLPPGGRRELAVRCQPHLHGMAYDTLSLVFDAFAIGRFLQLRCGDLDLLDDLKPSAPYVKRKRRARAPEPLQIVPAPEERKPAPDPEWRHLPRSLVPRYWRQMPARQVAEVLASGAETVREVEGSGGPGGALLREYEAHATRLLWTEELQLEADLSDFDLVDERVCRDLAPRAGGLLALHVKGLAEKRPSVLRGDVVRLKYPGGDKTWEGRAEQIQMEDVLLRVSGGFVSSYVRRSPVEVRFVLGRGPLRIFYQGVKIAGARDDGAHLARILFPPDSLDDALLLPPRVDAAKLEQLRLHNPHVQTNEAQLAAVRAVVQGVARRVPYVIFGPPGTGKTTTVVECIQQARKLRGRDSEKFRILACAPTNTAADLLCSLLARGGLSRLEMLRLNAFSRARGDVGEDVLRFSPWDAAEDGWAPPTRTRLGAFEVVIATLSTAGKLTNAGVPRGHFDLLVIDEAAQALEPEALAPVATLWQPGVQLLLAGDPKQLGPVIHHTGASEYGLAVSLLERLMARALYGRCAGGEYEGRVLTKLVRNFRSHDALLQLPSRLFYENELLACADDDLKRYCARWERLPTRGVPLLFDGIVGKDSREANSPSWFNADECTRIYEYVLCLLGARGGRPIRPTDIGVITPYNKQAQKLTRLFKAGDLAVGANGIKVGSTELFQGQERKVILISTVRSSADYIGFDLKHNLGFLSNPKRFNVAVTRACSLLVVVGNPHVLASDPHWNALLRYCVQKGAYVGEPLSPEAEGSAEAEEGRDDGGGGAGDDHSATEADEEARLAELNELLDGLDVSEKVQQEGLEMPTFD